MRTLNVLHVNIAFFINFPFDHALMKRITSIIREIPALCQGPVLFLEIIDIHIPTLHDGVHPR